jgi:hypothetical protein
MEFHDNDHVYQVIPDVLGIRAEYDEYLKLREIYGDDPDRFTDPPKEVKPVICHLKGISLEAYDLAVMSENNIKLNHTTEKATELIAESSNTMVGDRVVKIENLVCGGKEITTFSEACKHAPRVLCNWIRGMVHSEELLMEHEIKN